MWLAVFCSFTWPRWNSSVSRRYCYRYLSRLDKQINHAFTPDMKAIPKCWWLNFVAFWNTLFHANSIAALHTSLWRRQSHNALQQATYVEYFKWILFSFLGFGNVSHHSWVNFYSDIKIKNKYNKYHFWGFHLLQ